MQLNEHGFYDIYGLWHVPFWQRTSFWVVVLSISIIFFLLSLGWFIYNRKKTKKVLTPWQRAINGLDQVQREIGNQISSNEAYTRMLIIIKNYLDERYGLCAATKTDDELIPYLKQQPCCEQIMQDIEQLSKGAIFIKYANASFDLHHMTERLSHAVSIVQRTIPEQPSTTS